MTTVSQVYASAYEKSIDFTTSCSCRVMVAVPAAMSSALSKSFSIASARTGKRYFDKAAVDKARHLLGLNPLRHDANCIVIDERALQLRLANSGRGPFCKQTLYLHTDGSIQYYNLADV